MGDRREGPRAGDSEALLEGLAPGWIRTRSCSLGTSYPAAIAAARMLLSILAGFLSISVKYWSKYSV